MAEAEEPRNHQAHDHDVFVLVKAFVSDHDLSQPPLLVDTGLRRAEIVGKLQRLAMSEVPCVFAARQLAAQRVLL